MLFDLKLQNKALSAENFEFQNAFEVFSLNFVIEI
jgi:hypothetical protein